MGRASKFSFPFPGRKPSTPTRDKENHTRSPNQHSSYLPKAQRILGTDNELNIDSPARDDDRSWDHPSSTSSVSGMSISISESSRSIHDGASVAESHMDRWELESGVLPRHQQLRGKPSSTLLGQHYGDEPGTDTSSSSRRMNREGSSSTLKSYYDRQKSPLAISQQTSASSSRDLALRKGCPPVVARSPLLQVDQIQHIDERVVGLEPKVEVSPARSRKKTGRFELMTLFPKSRKNGDVDYSGPATAPPTAPPYAMSSNRQYIAQGSHSDVDDRRPQIPTKESWQSPNPNVRPSDNLHEAKKRHTNDTLSGLYDRYEQLEIGSPRMLNIPESRVLEYDKPMRSPLRVYHELDGENGQEKKRGSVQSPVETPFSWKNMRSNMVNRPWESSSAASVSSRNTKTSRRTSASVLSNSNLKTDSVLALSSGSENESSDRESGRHSAPPVSRAASQPTRDSRRQSSQSQGAPPRTHGSKRASGQVRPSFTIPESQLPSTRISGPWSPPELEDGQSTRSYSSDKRERRTSKTPSSKRSSKHSTPPLSPVPPIPAEYRDDAGRSSRLMAVTEQEVALLEALRHKKARMRKEIIEEHETARTPPRASRTKAPPRRSEVPAPGPTDSKKRILLYLDTPLSDGHIIDASEPSPDLSDFLTFGSDEDSTPRSSWAPLPNTQARPDSSVSPNTTRSSRKSQKKSPITPPNAARLSAVGAIAAFPSGRSQEPDSKTRLSNGAGVQLLDERRLANALLMDEQAGAGMAWAV